MPRPATDMSGRLADTLRQTFAPVGIEPSAVEARIAALCARIDTIGEDRRAAPFRPDVPEQR